VSFHCVVCTIALAPEAVEKKSFQGQGFFGPPYVLRGWMLRNVLLPWLSTMDFDSLTVSGVWEDGPGYKYVNVPPVTHNIGDLFLQRQAAFDSLSGSNSNDWFLFLNDDTLWDPRNARPSSLEEWGVMSPSRWCRSRDQRGERVNDGSAESSEWNKYDYVNFHGTLVKRWVQEQVPWKSFEPVYGMDVSYTNALNFAGIPWRKAPEYRLYDLELFSTPWE
jgi:hypothetical protein